MVATLATVNAILKEIYGPRIVNQLQDETVALKRIEKSSDGVITTVGGKYVDFPLRVQRNHGQGYRAEEQALPAAKRQGYEEAHVGLKYGYGRIRLTGQLMKLAEKNSQSFASAMDREMTGIKDDIAKDSNRIVYGDSTGLMASMAGTVAADTDHAVDDPQYLEVGMQVDVNVRATGAGADGATSQDISITAISGSTVTFSAAFDADAADGIYRQGSYDLEPNGFGNIISDTTVLHGLDPSTVPVWKSHVDDNSGTNRALSEGKMIEICDVVRTNGGKVSVIFNSLGVRRAYFNLLTQQRRYTSTKEFTGGLTGLAFNYGKEIPVVEDVDHPANKMYFLDESSMKVHQEGDWGWMDDDGNILKWVNDYDAYEAVLSKYWELCCERRNANALLDDITEG